jgi:hypothetical protein
VGSAKHLGLVSTLAGLKPRNYNVFGSDYGVGVALIRRWG